MASHGVDLPNVGVANNAKWMACRGISLNTEGTVEGYTKCSEFFVAPFDLDERNPRPDLRPQIVHGPFKCSQCDADELLLPVQRLVAFGTFFVGESGLQSELDPLVDPVCNGIPETPASFAETFTVGGMNKTTTEVLASSQRGPVPNTGLNKPELVASATGILTYFVDFRDNTYTPI